MRLHGALTLALLIFASLSGCAGDRRSPARPSLRRFRHVESSTVIDQAQAALRAEGFRIGQVDRAGGRITAYPISGTTASEQDSRPMGLSSAGRTRCIALVRFVEGDGSVIVSCSVEYQQVVTEARRMFEEHLGGFDRADDTPIDRGAAATSEQNTVWRVTRHDRRSEHRILAAIAQSLHVPIHEPASNGAVKHSP